jgi:hypothetical protein
MLTEWVNLGKFAPRNEEDIQCFLFHGIVVQLGTALGVHTKASRGNMWLGTKHFPDLVLGLDLEKPELVVEIKYRPIIRNTFYNGCKIDIDKMKKYYDATPHRFVLFDANPYFVFLDDHQLKELTSMASTNCKIHHFPSALNPSTGKAVARKAVDTMRKAGKDFRQMGLQSASKAKEGKE